MNEIQSRNHYLDTLSSRLILKKKSTPKPFIRFIYEYFKPSLHSQGLFCLIIYPTVNHDELYSLGFIRCNWNSQLCHLSHCHLCM